METIKKLLRPGGAEDDQTLYGQENTANTTDSKHQKSGLTGEGSHFSGSQAQSSLPGKDTSTVPSSTTQHGGGLTGQGSHLSGATDSSIPGQSQSSGFGHEQHGHSSATPSSTRQNEGLTGQGSHLSGATDSTTTGQSTGSGHGSMDPGATRHIGGGGLGHGQHERSDTANVERTALGGNNNLGGDQSKSTNTTQGPHSSDMMNKLDPRVDSDQSQTTRTSDQTGNYSGAGAGTGLGHREHEHSTDTTRGNTSLPGYGLGQGQTTSGPHSSDMLNKADPRVDSDFSNTRRAADQAGNYGGAGAGMTTSGHREHDHSTGTSRGNPILSQSTQSTTTQGPHSSNMMNKMDPRVDSDNSKNINSGAGYSSTTGSSHHTGTTTSGPHQTATANLLDPNVNTTGGGHEDAIRHHDKYGGGAEEADNDHRDGGKKAAVAGAVGLGAIGMGSEHHQSRFTERGADGSAGGNASMMPGTFPAESTHLTGSDSQPTTQNVSSIPDRSRTTNDPTTSVGEKEHHHGRDAALAGGAAGIGGAAYGAGKHSDNKASEPVHNSDMLNRIDPRVTTDNSGTAYGTNPTDRSHGIMTGATTSHQTSHTTPHSTDTENVGGQQHHHGRDTALGAGAVGGAYGLGRQHESQPQGVSTTSHQTTHPSNTENVRDQQHHHGRDAALGAGAAGGAYELGRQHESQPQGASTTSHQTSQTTPHSSNTENVRDQQHHYGRDATLGAGAAGAAYGLSRQHESQPQGVSTTSQQTSQTTPHSSNTDNVRDQQHHHGRDATVGAGAGGAAYGLGRQHESHPQGVSTSTTTTTNTSTSTTGPHSSDMLNRADPRVDSDRSQQQSKDHNYGRDAALVGGAGAAAVGARQLGDRDEKDLKQAEKDRKHEEKDHQHAQKEREKAALAAEKERHHREKEHEKQLKDNDKHDVKDEKHAEKEHKGLFSFLHRDKSKKYTQEEEDDFARQERDYNSSSSNTLVGSAQIGGTSLGDKLHGTARNRGVIGPSGFPEGGAPADPINHHTGEPLSTSHPLASEEAQRKPSLADKLHGVDRNRGVPSAAHGFPRGDGPGVDTNQHTGEPLGVSSHQTAPHTGHAVTHQTTHSTVDDDATHSHSRSGALGDHKQSVDEYNSSGGRQGDILSPTTDSYTHSGTGSSTTHQSSGVDAAPRHVTGEQKTDASGQGVLDPDSGVRTDQGVHAGESQGVGVGAGSDGRNRLHKDPPAGRY